MIGLSVQCEKCQQPGCTVRAAMEVAHTTTGLMDTIRARFWADLEVGPLNRYPEQLAVGLESLQVCPELQQTQVFSISGSFPQQTNWFGGQWIHDPPFVAQQVHPPELGSQPPQVVAESPTAQQVGLKFPSS